MSQSSHHQPNLFEVFGRRHAPAVPAINEASLRNLQELLHPQGVSLDRFILLRSPRSGYGKTHLLQALKTRLADSHLFFAVEPSGGGRIESADVLESVLRQLSRILPASGGLSELDLFARRLFACALQPLLEQGDIPCHDQKSALRALAERPIETFDFHDPEASTASWTRANFSVLAPRLAAELSSLSGATLRGCAYWLDLVFRYASSEPDESGRATLLIDATFGKIREEGAGGMEERLLSLLALLAKVQPLCLVFDETEGFSNQPEAGLRLAAFLGQLRNAVSGLSLILSVNDDVWKSGFLPLMSSGIADRLCENEVALQDLPRDLAEKLVQRRFGDHAPVLIEKMTWPAPLFARAVLREGARTAGELARAGILPADQSSLSSTQGAESRSGSNLLASPYGSEALAQIRSTAASLVDPVSSTSFTSSEIAASQKDASALLLEQTATHFSSVLKSTAKPPAARPAEEKGESAQEKSHPGAAVSANPVEPKVSGEEPVASPFTIAADEHQSNKEGAASEAPETTVSTPGSPEAEATSDEVETLLREFRSRFDKA
ncbi:hypothetical protein [Roseibacillus ishigakijimensis]|uniref:Uncharacterized protein n=1 Tax=Roseibacillus ishigakijimensis TaxID=454146 RepID=A0A934RTD2_9BACT|nr:hypothetical protein [Roseibacillus ishigakijimensis]MBK1833820.1 hypothetical protein [Roseibacillus ishigakijimensis]